MRLASPLRILSVASAVAFSLAAYATGCGSSGDTGSTTGDGGGAGDDSGAANADGGVVNLDSGVGGGDTDAPVLNTPYPIKHVVVFVKENHTFDNYFGTFPGAEGTTQCLTSSGKITCPHAVDPVPYDMCHEHSCALQAWDNGNLDGWDSIAPENSSADIHQPYGQYYESDIPNYWAYARKYTLGDHFFANMLGPSFPGHFFTIAAQAGWAIGNPGTQYTDPYWGCDQAAGTTLPVLDQDICAEQDFFPCFKVPSVPDVLPSGVDWRFYGSILPLIGHEPWTMFDAVSSISCPVPYTGGGCQKKHGTNWSHIVDESTFADDVANNKLPPLTWVVNQSTQSEHPNPGNICNNLELGLAHPCSICNGENWTVDKINAIMKSGYWKDTAIIITMDDWGGWYDHVPPPRQYGCDTKQPYGLGFRLPLIIVSPYAKPGFIFKEVSEQASIPRFIEKIFGSTKTLTDLDPAAQDGQANDLLGAFDFNQKPLDPLVLPLRNCP